MKTRSLCVFALSAGLCFGAEASIAQSAHSSSAKAGKAKDIVSTALAAGQFKTLAVALKTAGYVKLLRGRGPFTVFAPTDAAFRKLPKGTIAALLKPENRGQLQAILKLHVVKGRVDSTTALKVADAPTLLGETVSVRLEGGQLRVGTAKVVANDVAASNGVIHVIDTVLLPKPKIATGPVALIEYAIDQGAPLYNAGQRDACAALYSLCVRSLLELPDNKVPAQTRKMLRGILEVAESKKSAMDRAWALRGGLDKAWSRLQDDGAQKTTRVVSRR